MSEWIDCRRQNMNRRTVTLIGIGLSAAVVVPAGKCDAPASGVFIAHHPAGLEFSAGTDWCQQYLEEFAIESCSEQHPRIDVDHEGQSAVWYVLVAFTDSTEWVGTEFGLGTYSDDSFLFADHEPCFPDNGLEIPMGEWPGPNQGTAFITTGEPWSGSIQPVYYFAGYAYAADLIPLGMDPARGFGGTCTAGLVQRPAEAFGALGLFRDGVAVYPKAPPTEVSGWFSGDSKEPPRTPIPRGTKGVPDSASWQAELPPDVIESLRHTALAAQLGLSSVSQAESLVQVGDTLQGHRSPGAEQSISFTLEADARVSLEVYDASGRLVCAAFNGTLARGAHEIPLGQAIPEADRAGSEVCTVRLKIDGVPSGEKVMTLPPRRCDE
jgi:hypothetical protein